MFAGCQGNNEAILKNIKTLLNKTENSKTQVESLITSDGKIITLQQLIANTFCEHITNGMTISTKVIKYCKATLVPLLTHNINMVLQTDEFPDVLKIAQVVPLHKTGAKNVLNNYRPISVLSVISKIYERIIHSRLMI
ncbi:hypothetical protein PR048_024022, partial [Dryococelus australis]